MCYNSPRKCAESHAYSDARDRWLISVLFVLRYISLSASTPLVCRKEAISRAYHAVIVVTAMTRCYLLLKALFSALELLVPVAILAILDNVRAATTRAFIGDKLSDHTSVYHQLALNHYQFPDFQRWVKTLELDPGSVGTKLPVHLDTTVIAVFRPNTRQSLQLGFVTYLLIQAMFNPSNLVQDSRRNSHHRDAMK
jgi:hypothetical protein